VSKLHGYELDRLPAPAHQILNWLRWSHPAEKLTTSSGRYASAALDIPYGELATTVPKRFVVTCLLTVE
jgi:hypothetical protein